MRTTALRDSLVLFDDDTEHRVRPRQLRYLDSVGHAFGRVSFGSGRVGLAIMQQ